jgi:hypothetical protein
LPNDLALKAFGDREEIQTINDTLIERIDDIGN